MDIQAEIKRQSENAIAIQQEILESLASGKNPTNNDVNKLKILNLTFDNFLKIRESLDKFLGDIETNDYLSDSKCIDSEESIY
jgi:hypothetical protein